MHPRRQGGSPAGAAATLCNGARAMTDPTTLPEKGDPSALYVIDISSYVFRAYHALPPLSSSRGEPTHAVHGVTSMLMKLVKERDPKRLVVAVDARGGSFRKELDPRYKANRPPPPEDLEQQVKRVFEIVRAMGIPCLERPTFEADDVIATIVRQAKEEGLKTVIVSADKDLLQLVGPDVVMYDTMRENVFGEAETVAKMGVLPAQVRDLLALMGDASDNVPGVPGVGQKTAAKLLADHGDLEGIYARIDAVKGKLREKLLDYRDDATLSQKLVSLRDDVEIGFDPKDCTYGGGDAATLRKLFVELELTRLLGQVDLVAAPSSADDGAPPPAAEQGEYRIILTRADLERVLRAIVDSNEVAIVSFLDIDDPHRGKLVGVGLSWAEHHAVYVPLWHRYVGAPEMVAESEALELLAPVLSNSLIRKRCSDLKREILIWAERGVPFRGGAFDTMLASYLLDPERHGHDLELIARAELGAELAQAEPLLGKGKHRITLDQCEVERVGPFAAERADYVLRLSRLLAPRMAESPLRELMYELELPLATVLATMQQTGIRIDSEFLTRLAKEAEGELARLEARCHTLAGKAFNVGSPRQLETILFDELGLPVQKRTKTARSTDQTVLEDLSLLHDLPAAILTHRSLAKLKSTYLDALPLEVRASTGRIHTKFNQAVAATGRISSSDPNLQNIPIRTEEGRRIREAFVPADGFELMSADYSQIELRVLAHLSSDPELVEAYVNREDVHVRTATALFGVPKESVDRDMRGRAKTVNFAVIYGQTQFALARNLRIERSEAKRYIDAFFERYAGVRAFMDRIIEEAHAKGFVTTLAGRRRSLPDIRSQNHNLRAAAERVARNTPIQGTAADIIKRAMIDVASDLRREKMRSRMVLTVHDELVFEAPAEEKSALEAIVKARMEGAAELSVPLEIEMGWGGSWGAAH
jgi:DNA polymerase I